MSDESGATVQRGGKIPTEDLLDEIRRLSEDGVTGPTCREMSERGKYARKTYRIRFGGWNDAVREAGLEPANASTSGQLAPKDDLLEEIRRLADGDEPPMVEEMNEDGNFSVTTYRYRFGSWNKAVEEAGLDPRLPGREPIPDEELLVDINIGSELLGEWPTYRQYVVYGEYHPLTVRRAFGTWCEGVEAAKEYREEEWEPLPDDLGVGHAE